LDTDSWCRLKGVGNEIRAVEFPIAVVSAVGIHFLQPNEGGCGGEGYDSCSREWAVVAGSVKSEYAVAAHRIKIIKYWGSAASRKGSRWTSPPPIRAS
jgi:hypothetical protein